MENQFDYAAICGTCGAIRLQKPEWRQEAPRGLPNQVCGCGTWAWRRSIVPAIDLNAVEEIADRDTSPRPNLREFPQPFCDSYTTRHRIRAIPAPVRVPLEPYWTRAQSGNRDRDYPR